METKLLPHFVKSLDVEARTVTGISAVHGNEDDGGDMSVNGAFSKSLSERRQRVRFLWNHNGYNPPIASIKEIREVGRDELPDNVLAYAPEATGGLLVTRKYYDGIPLADWVFKGIVEGDITEMSYAYDVKDYEIIKREGKRDLRILKEVALYDISDVNWGMNPATSGVKGLLATGLTFTQHAALVVATYAEFMARVSDRKAFRAAEGRTLSAGQRDALVKMRTEIDAILRELQPRADEAEVRHELAKFLKNR